jgi:thioredoxin-dependent peroxiredoxin
VRDEIDSFRAAGVQPLGVNPATAERHAKYAAKLRFGFPLLSDTDRAIAAAYGALKEDGRAIQRTVYGIQRDGTVAFSARGAPSPSDVIAALQG